MDVFREDFSSGLLPIRGIKHQIDLISIIVIPNHLAYTSNPKETKELQGQVKKLMVKYRLLISRLDDILDELHGSCVFTKIDLKSEHYHIRMKKR
jgi:hypothetical protein